MGSRTKEKTTLKAFGGFNYHQYSVPVILITIATLFFCAYTFSFERPMLVVTCITLVLGIGYLAGTEGTPESRQLSDYMHYLDCQNFRDLHRSLKSRKVDAVSKAHIKRHMDEKYPDWDDTPKKKSAEKGVVTRIKPSQNTGARKAASAKGQPEGKPLRRPIVKAA